MIENPGYQGVWVHPQITNPDYKVDSKVYAFNSHAFVGFDLWQVKSGTIFDNIIITDSLNEAKAFYEETTGATIEGEKKMKMKADEEARKKAEEEAEKREEGYHHDLEDFDYEDDEDDDDEDDTFSKDEL